MLSTEKHGTITLLTPQSSIGSPGHYFVFETAKNINLNDYGLQQIIKACENIQSQLQLAISLQDKWDIGQKVRQFKQNLSQMLKQKDNCSPFSEEMNQTKPVEDMFLQIARLRHQMSIMELENNALKVQCRGKITLCSILSASSQVDQFSSCLSTTPILHSETIPHLTIDTFIHTIKRIFRTLVLVANIHLSHRFDAQKQLQDLTQKYAKIDFSSQTQSYAWNAHLFAQEILNITSAIHHLIFV